MGDKVKYKSGLTDAGQRQAQTVLLNQMRGGDQSLVDAAGEITAGAGILNPINEQVGGVLEKMLASSGSDFLPGDAYKRYLEIASGKVDPLSDDSGLFGAMVKNVEQAGTRAREQAMAAAGKFGNQFSSASRAAGISAEAEGNITGKAEIAKILAQREVQRQQFRYEAANLLAQAAKWAIDSKLTAAQIKIAAEQWAKGMSYQEWARQHPTVAQLAQVIYGKDIDTIAEKKKSWLGPALVGVASIIGTIATGGALAPALAAGAASAYKAYSGGGDE